MKNSKLATRTYDLKVDGTIFNNAVTFESKKDSNFFNLIEEQIREKYTGEQLDKIDHNARIIYLNYL